MLFNSYEFLIFFPIVTLLFYALPHKFRWVHLLIASSIFYMFFIPQYILILLVTILIDYIAAIYIEQSTGHRKKMLLIISVLSTIMVLFIFKYLDFFDQNMVWLSQKFHFPYHQNAIKLILPIGLSFHTFQSLSYVIEVYRGRQKPERNFGIYSLYVMFYPQLVTGPIERPQNLLVQLRQIKIFSYENLANGLRLIIFGLFIKMVIADNIAVFVDQIYDHPADYSSFSILIGLVFYSIQIYCDFYGYSTIAVGCAKVMGYDLMDNFKNPYLSKSIGEFWQRWHISLSTWFRDYVYFSLGGNRVKIKRWAINILIVFVLSGFWHGANWTFIIWGFAHGLIYVIETVIGKFIKIDTAGNKAATRFFNVFLTIRTFVIVTFIWILFRATSMEQVGIIFKSLLKNIDTGKHLQVDLKLWIFLGIFLIVDYLLFNTRFDSWIGQKKLPVRWTIYTAIIFLIIVFSSVNNFPFIYFQF